MMETKGYKVFLSSGTIMYRMVFLRPISFKSKSLTDVIAAILGLVNNLSVPSADVKNDDLVLEAAI